MASYRARPITMKVVPSLHSSPLQRLASWFHQDFGLAFQDVQSGAAAYFKSLNSADRQLLMTEIAPFLATHEGSSEKALRRAWMKLGAQYWPRRADTQSILRGFLTELRSVQNT